jgi:hypothetical protein
MLPTHQRSQPWPLPLILPPFYFRSLTDLLTAVITLTAITQGIIPSKRVLKLNPECQTVPVGRASKSVSKGLISAEDNAWFDNPVMSRDHAELILKQEDMVSVLMPVLRTHWLISHSLL